MFTALKGPNACRVHGGQNVGLCAGARRLGGGAAVPELRSRVRRPPASGRGLRTGGRLPGCQCLEEHLACRTVHTFFFQFATLPRWHVPCRTEMAAKAESLELIVQQVKIACLCGYLRKYCSLRRLRQREFFTFGMDVLLKLDLQETRQFFTAFFSLSDFYWQVAHHSCLI